MVAQKAPAHGRTLDDLILDHDELEDSELAAALHGRIGLIDRQTIVRLLGTFAEEPTKKRIVAVGLARHAMKRKGWVEDDGLGAPPEWYANQVQQKPKSVGEELSRLKKAGFMDRNRTGWYVPLWALRQAIDFVNKA